MPIPRLPPAAQPLNVTVTISEILLPYFQLWFQQTKMVGESPSQFALRALKQAALNDFLKGTAKIEIDGIDQSKKDGLAALALDIDNFKGEI